MHTAFPPFAAVDWGELIIFLLIVGTSLAGKLMQANQQRRAKKKKGLPQPAPMRGKIAQPKPPRPIPKPVPRRALGAPEEKLEQEIEVFLRRAGGKQPTPQNPRPTPPVPPARSASLERVAAEKKPQPRKTLRNESVGEHVQRHIRTGGIAQRDAHLGDHLEQADERIEEHLHDVFDHKLGRLSQIDTEIREGTDAGLWNREDVASPLANQLFQMLSSPQNVGAAIVLSEILRRPEERWSDEADRW